MQKKPLIIGLVIVAIAGVLIFAYYSGNSNDEGNNTANTAPTTAGLTFDESTLLDRGVTSDQLSNLEQALGQYLDSQGKSTGRIDFNSIYRTPPDPAQTTPFSELTFMVQLDGQPIYKAKLNSFSTSEIRLYLYSPDGSTLLYDSQNIGGSSGQE